MSNEQHQQKTIQIEDPTSVELVVEEEEIQDLERQVPEIAERILHFRRTVPDLLKKTLESSLIAKRHVLPRTDAAEAGIRANGNLGEGENIELSKRALLATEDPETSAEICLLKSKISSNVSAMPVILKKMDECIAAIDRLDRCNVDIHPAFKRKQTQ